MKVIQEDCSTVQKKTIGLTETSVKKYQHSQRNNTEELGSNLHPAGQFKSRNLIKFITNIWPIVDSSCQTFPVSGRLFVQTSPTECGVPTCDGGTSQKGRRTTRFVEPWRKRKWHSNSFYRMTTSDKSVACGSNILSHSVSWTRVAVLRRVLTTTFAVEKQSVFLI